MAYYLVVTVNIMTFCSELTKEEKEEKEAILFFKTKLKGGVYHIEDYKKEKGLSITDEANVTDNDL